MSHIWFVSAYVMAFVFILDAQKFKDAFDEAKNVMSKRLKNGKNLLQFLSSA